VGAQESWPKARSGKLPVGSLREGAAPRPEARLRRAPRSRPALHGLRCWDGERRDGAAANLEDAASPELMSAPSSPGSTVCRTGWPCSLVRVLRIGLKPGIPRFTDLSAIATGPFGPGLSRGSMRVLSGARCVPAGSGLPWRTCTPRSSGSRRTSQRLQVVDVEDAAAFLRSGLGGDQGVAQLRRVIGQGLARDGQQAVSRPPTAASAKMACRSVLESADPSSWTPLRGAR
jgi:hypothetical protein